MATAVELKLGVGSHFRIQSQEVEVKGYLPDGSILFYPPLTGTNYNLYVFNADHQPIEERHAISLNTPKGQRAKDQPGNIIVQSIHTGYTLLVRA